MNLLSPLGILYGRIADLRNALYDRGRLKSYSLGARTISIGNITAGGTGKTPLVALVADILAENGEKVCILTRGYGREEPRSRVLVSDGQTILADAKRAGDEPLELAQKLFDKAVIIADADRVSAAKWAMEKFGVTAFVLDDGFQHRRAKRDLDIVCIDATNPFGNGKMLPAGILREPLENLKRADAIVITRANLVAKIEDLKSEISKYYSTCPIFLAEVGITDLIDLKEFHRANRFRKGGSPNVSKGALANVRASAFCALGNPENFFEQLKQEGFNLTSTHTFPDHHYYTHEDVKKLEKKAKGIDSAILLTTAKDAVKLKGLRFEMPCYVVEIEPVFQDEGSFRALIRG